VLEGSVQKADNRIRITVQLIDAIKGRHLWAERYDRELEDLFALQDEIALKIITSLRVKLTEGEMERIAGTDNLRAYRTFRGFGQKAPYSKCK
jgi:adenylate cyclase